jgi:outer membrane protein OmpA-like peptidoglycan-associated protein
MKNVPVRFVWTIGLLGMSVAALAAPESPPQQTPPQEPAGFIAGGIVGGLAAGPIGAVIGAGVGTWLGSRVNRAGDAAKAEAKVAALQSEKAALASQTTDLAETNRALTARLDQLSQSVDERADARGNAREEASKVLDGLQGDVLFRTGSAQITPDMAHGIEGLAQAVARSPTLKVRVDGYADARGAVDANLKLSQARADAVRDMFLAAGVTDDALEINAYGKSQSVARDYDGYALERRVRLTLQAEDPAAVAQSARITGGADHP